MNSSFGQKSMTGRRRREFDPGPAGISRTYGDALRAADGYGAERVALECLHEGMSVETLYGQVIAPAMWRIGRLWEEGALTIADEHLSTAITQRVMASVYGSSFGRAAPRPGRILLAAVEGQHHALGLRMAADVLELGGYEVIYLGGDVPIDALLGAIESRRPDLLALSSTLAPDRSSIGVTIPRLREAFPEMAIILGGQGVPAGILDGDRVIASPPLEGLLALVAATLANRELIAREDESPGSSAQIDPPYARSPGGDTSEARLLGAASEAADLARSNARLAHNYRQLAYRDPITRGPNRNAFDDRLELINDSPQEAPVVVAMLDLDGFKQVNDSLGHAAGDALLATVARAIEGCLRTRDFTARLGGDEFALLLARTELDEAGEIAGRVLAAIRDAGSAAAVTGTIGMARLDGDPRRTMLEADLALYRGKAAGRDRVELAAGK